MSMQVYKFNVPTFGKDVVFDVSHKVRAEQFKMFSEGLKISKMTDYVPLFVQEAEVALSFFWIWTLYRYLTPQECQDVSLRKQSNPHNLPVNCVITARLAEVSMMKNQHVLLILRKGANG